MWEYLGDIGWIDPINHWFAHTTARFAGEMDGPPLHSMYYVVEHGRHVLIVVLHKLEIQHAVVRWQRCNLLTKGNVEEIHVVDVRYALV